ncbi:MAG: M48 family metallopeptidase [Acidimicrobiia bacterium]|nr:M48 family metallopeptidase [Acidimicrobiia bacterium]
MKAQGSASAASAGCWYGTSGAGWGSCAPDGTLRFNWRVMMLKPPLLECVVVHELAHLVHAASPVPCGRW